MTITYPINMPTDVIGFASIELRAENVVSMSQSPFTFRQQVFRHPGQRWTASISVAPINRDLSEPWVAFLLALNGQSGTFLLGDPLGEFPRGSLSSGTIEVDGAQAAQASSIDMKGFPNSETNILRAGDYIQLGSAGTATLHKVLLDVNSDSDGKASVAIWPYTRRALVDEETVVYQNPKGRFRLAQNQQSWSITPDLRYGISFDAVEAL